MVKPSWAPLGAKRFLELVDGGFYDKAGLFRVVPDFLVQFGIPRSKQHRSMCADPSHTIRDDPDIGQTFSKGMMSFAGSGPDSRSCQIFITLGDHTGLGKADWERPFGYVTKETMDIVDQFNAQYGDMPPWGNGPESGQIATQGNAYLKKNFPRLDYVQNCRREEEAGFTAPPNLSGSIMGDGKRPRVTFSVMKLNGGGSGVFTLEVVPEWAPLGAKRFLDLIEDGFYANNYFFRVVSGFVVQFGISGNSKMNRKWDKKIQDDKVVASNTRGMVSFASAGPGTRTTQLFINLGNNARLDSMGFSPFARVVAGMDVVDEIFKGYGEKPDQGAIKFKGNAYLRKSFPKLSFIHHAFLEKAPVEKKAGAKESFQSMALKGSAADSIHDDAADYRGKVGAFAGLIALVTLVIVVAKVMPGKPKKQCALD